MAPTHYIYIDYQNTGDIDLAPPADAATCIVLALGSKTEKLSAAFQKSLLKFTHVHFLKSVTEGRNAVDFLIAKDIGIQIARDPTASFHIISQDKDFDSLVKNLQSDQIAAARWESFAEIQFSPAPPSTPEKPGAVPSTADHAARITEALAKSAKTRPARESKLRTYIGNRIKEIDPSEIDQTITALKKAKTLTIDRTGKITYPTNR